MDGFSYPGHQLPGQRVDPHGGGAGVSTIAEAGVLRALRLAAGDVRGVLLQYARGGDGGESVALQHRCVDGGAAGSLVLYGGGYAPVL